MRLRFAARQCCAAGSSDEEWVWGAVKLARRHVDALVCVRYRHDAQGLNRYSTVELVVDSAPVQARAAVDRVVGVKLDYNEKSLHTMVRARGQMGRKGEALAHAAERREATWPARPRGSRAALDASHPWPLLRSYGKIRADVARSVVVHLEVGCLQNHARSNRA